MTTTTTKTPHKQPTNKQVTTTTTKTNTPHSKTKCFLESQQQHIKTNEDQRPKNKFCADSLLQRKLALHFLQIHLCILPDHKQKGDDLELMCLTIQTQPEAIYLLSRNAPGDKHYGKKYLTQGQCGHKILSIYILPNILQIKMNYLIMTQMKFWNSNTNKTVSLRK